MKIRLVICLSILILALVCLPAPKSAQQPASSQPVLVLKAQAPATGIAHDVVLPVTVRDKKGLVSSVKVSDFTLTEDSRPQKIKSFTRETGLPFRLGLLVDTSRSMTGAMDSERKATGKFVDTMLPEKPSDKPSASLNQAFLIHFDREVELLYDFTTSRDKLHHELDEMGPSRAAQNESRNSDSGGNNNGGNGGYGGGRGRGQGQGQQGQARGRRSTTQLYDAIYLASDEVMKNQQGRKALVVFSDGVDRGSKMTLNDAVDAADKAGLAVYTIYLKGEEERPVGAGIPGMGGGRHGGMGGGGIPGMGGGRGGGGGGGQREQEVDGKKIMEKIATRTGGHYYEAKKKDNLDEIYGQIAEELRGQFLLTYTPDQVDKEGGFHKIVLKSNKEDLTVITREGYYAPPEK
jgi:VWFA-related protein